MITWRASAIGCIAMMCAVESLGIWGLAIGSAAWFSYLLFCCATR